MKGHWFGAALALTLAVPFGGGAIAAQDAPAAAMPATIVPGSCDDLDQEATVQLADVTYGLGENGEPGIPAALDLVGPTETALVATGVTQLDMTVEDLTNSPHAVAIFESSEMMTQNAVACGPIGGIAPTENLFFGLREQNDSGYAGIGWVNTAGDTTLLTVMLTSLEATVGEGAPTAAMAPEEPTGTADASPMAEMTETPMGMEEATPATVETAVTDTASPAAEAELPVTEASPTTAGGAEAEDSATVVASPMAESSPAAAAAGDEAADTVTIESVDIDFIPEEVTIPANTDVTIMLPNNGAILHNFSLDEKNNENLPIDPISIDIQPGATEQTTVNLPPGEYYFYCNIPGHEAAGMFGNLIVE